MFKEIELEIMSMVSNNPIEKIAHMVSADIAKTVEIIYNIDCNNIEKVYTEDLKNDLMRATVIYKSNAENPKIGSDICTVNGKICNFILIPYEIFNIDTTNAAALCESIIEYISLKINLIIVKCEHIFIPLYTTKMQSILSQSIPVLTCAVMKQLFNGPSLSEVIYISLCNIINSYKTVSSQEGINSILNLLDEGLTVTELLDNGFICSIPKSDKKYPGIWGKNEEEEK